MRVFVAGATGVIGRPLVRQLIAGQHRVFAMTSRAEAAEELERMGATPVVCDALDTEALEREVLAAEPAAVINQLTRLPPAYDPKRVDLEPTNRLRREAGPALAHAAAKAGAGRYIVESIALIYAPEGEMVKDETGRPWTDAPPPFGTAVGPVLDLENAALNTPGVEGIVLRYPHLYGPGTWYASDGSTAELVRARRFPVVGGGHGCFSFVHAEDAASAAVCALDRGEPGIYNVADDEPAPVREWLPVYAQALGAKRPRRVPLWLGRLIAGEAARTIAAGSRGASNAKARAELGWEPRYPSWRQGFFEALG